MPEFSASTREVCARLGLQSNRSLLRRKLDTHETARPHQLKFLKEGLHFRAKSPGCKALIWDLERTVKAWEAAVKNCSRRGN